MKEVTEALINFLNLYEISAKQTVHATDIKTTLN